MTENERTLHHLLTSQRVTHFSPPGVSISLHPLDLLEVSMLPPFCRSHVIAQFFCDVPSVIRLSCSKTYAAFKLVQATLLLLVFQAALTGNPLIIAITTLIRQLHTSIYFFLRNRVEPSYDRCAAICFPLTYDIVLARGACGKMATASWFGGGLYAITCSGNHNVIDATVILGAALCVVCPISIVILCAHIFRVVLSISAAEGWAKAFSTCLPPLGVVTVFLSNRIFVYVKPPADSSFIVDLLVSVFYMVVTPSLNLLIYSLRNQNMNAAMGRIQKGNIWEAGMQMLLFPREPQGLKPSLMLQGTGPLSRRNLRNHVNRELFVLKAMSYDRYAAI
ncbi:olfactory receptor 14A2-like [Tachyglossus aculeatus]|uniref:olfactory receptor 14A2-like n=1 Tax=Tachyglossus aculeatus TaxID=9261 RepID=UPI0018F3E591|nr:olfactory receptor 14A2-like [Tachyglossus aculeatus]